MACCWVLQFLEPSKAMVNKWCINVLNWTWQIAALDMIDYLMPHSSAIKRGCRNKCWLVAFQIQKPQSYDPFSCLSTITTIKTSPNPYIVLQQASMIQFSHPGGSNPHWPSPLKVPGIEALNSTPKKKFSQMRTAQFWIYLLKFGGELRFPEWEKWELK